MRNLKLTLSYDGTLFHGWQTQPSARTVQDTLQDTASLVLKEPIKVTGCSRTDAGVHAKRYVCNFFTNCSIDAARVPIALNTRLPADVRVAHCEEVDASFHARISAKSKTYRYVVNNSGQYDVFLRNFHWYFPKRLDIPSMQRAAAHFVGTHDFAACMAAGSEVAGTVRTVHFLNLAYQDGWLEIFINADGYLYNMVRIMVGTLIGVGTGRFAPDDIKGILASGNRKNAGMTAPPQGLSLWQVYY